MSNNENELQLELGMKERAAIRHLRRYSAGKKGLPDTRHTGNPLPPPLPLDSDAMFFATFSASSPYGERNDFD